MPNNKPWAAQGLSYAKRAEALETCLILQELDIDKIEEAIEAAVRDAEPQWIPVTERLPSVYERVLVRCAGDRIHICYLDEWNQWRYGSNNESIYDNSVSH